MLFSIASIERLSCLVEGLPLFEEQENLLLATVIFAKMLPRTRDGD